MIDRIRRAWANLTTSHAADTHTEGYPQWYCQKRRGHGKQTPARGLVSSAHIHRFNNYTWIDGQKAEYSPIPFDVQPKRHYDLHPRAWRSAVSPANPEVEAK